MSTTDIVLIVVIALMLAYAIYDEFIQPLRQGGTRLLVPLRRTNRLLTTTLLISLVVISIYLSYIRRPKLLFKASGFIYANIFIPYTRIRNMNLSEDGILVVELEKRLLLISVQQLDDLEKYIIL
ncbi:MAG: DUF986 family protein [Symbiopectobacterium sp.]|uniref:DUF986 family protein n=1 Tax=Symbiopectobacterium sp. TaxID=2952789 RepID=UPI0039EB793E